jgi:hypothetical protein
MTDPTDIRRAIPPAFTQFIGRAYLAAPTSAWGVAA